MSLSLFTHSLHPPPSLTPKYSALMASSFTLGCQSLRRREWRPLLINTAVFPFRWSPKGGGETATKFMKNDRFGTPKDEDANERKEIRRYFFFFFFLLITSNSVSCHTFFILPSNTHLPCVQLSRWEWHVETTLTKASGCENNLRLIPNRTVAFWTKSSGLLVGDYGQLDAVTIKGPQLDVILIEHCLIYVHNYLHGHQQLIVTQQCPRFYFFLWLSLIGDQVRLCMSLLPLNVMQNF